MKVQRQARAEGRIACQPCDRARHEHDWALAIQRCQLAGHLVEHARPYICPPAWPSRTNPRPALGRFAWSTHGLFTEDQWRALLAGCVQATWITDAVLSRRRPARAQIVPVAPLLAHVLGSRD
ncbi:MAG: hypothetical protein ACXVSL_10160 [Solirubrobacteraceae bacterium]